MASLSTVPIYIYLRYFMPERLQGPNEHRAPGFEKKGMWKEVDKRAP